MRDFNSPSAIINPSNSISSNSRRITKEEASDDSLACIAINNIHALEQISPT